MEALFDYVYVDVTSAFRWILLSAYCHFRDVPTPFNILETSK